MILVIGFIIIMQQPAEIKKEGAFHKEASLSACNSYANANDHTCQTSCWQQTQAMNDCMIAYNGESRDLGYYYEYHSSSFYEAACKTSLEWDMAGNMASYNLVKAAVKCIPTLQAYGAVIPCSPACVSPAVCTVGVCISCTSLSDILNNF